MATRDSTQQRASEYRELANELLADARAERDTELRTHLTDAANACLKIAQRLETLPASAR